MQHRPLTTEQNRQERHKPRTGGHPEERGHPNLPQPLNQQVHGRENNTRRHRSRPAAAQSNRKRRSPKNIRQPDHRRRVRFRAVRNLTQPQIRHLKGDATGCNLVNQLVNGGQRLVVLRRRTHHPHQGVGEPLIQAHTLHNARLHVRVRVRGVVNRHRLVGNIHLNRIQAERRRNRNNSGIHIHGIRPVMEHRLSKTQSVVQGVPGVLLLAAERLTRGLLLLAALERKLPLSDTGAAAQGGALGARTHK